MGGRLAPIHMFRVLRYEEGYGIFIPKSSYIDSTALRNDHSWPLEVVCLVCRECGAPNQNVLDLPVDFCLNPSESN